MKTSKKGKRVDVPIRDDLHREVAHLAVDSNSTIQMIVDELIELGLQQKKLQNKNEKDNSL